MRSILFAVLRKLSPKLSSGIFIGTMLLIALSSLIWFQGPKFRYLEYAPFASPVNRLLSIGVLIVLWGINNMIVARRAARMKPKNAVATAEKPRDLVEAEIALLRQSFRNTMQIIRSKWSGKERGARSAYALPWYLVLGPAGAGKTSLVLDSDLKFPLSHLLNQGDIRTAHSTSLPQYWVTSEGVLFDMPGAWIDQTFDASQDDDTGNVYRLAATRNAMASVQNPGEMATARSKRLWAAFTDLLVEFRPRRPINGVILCIDAVELVRASDEARINMAASLHGRLVELSERLGTRFIVHVVITKLDRLAGFRDFFAQLSKQDRTAPFGFSFPIHDEVSADKWVEDFDTHFAKFVERANDEMIDRLYAQRDNDSRRNIYTFSRELSGLGSIVAEFFKRALHSDRFSTPPLVRGIYFSSTRQQGVPFNALLSRFARDYHLPSPVLPAFSGHSVRYFTDALFQRVIFREAGLAGDNKAVERRKRVALSAAVLASVLSVMGLGFLLNEAMRDNSARAANVLSISEDFVTLPREAAEANKDAEVAYLPALNAIRAANEEFPNWRERTDARRYLVLYQGRRIGPEVDKAYEGLLRERFIPAIASKVKERVETLGRSKDTADSDERLDALRVYLLLGDLAKRNELDTGDGAANQGRSAILAWMKRHWQERFEGSHTTQIELSSHLEYALDTARIAAPLDPSAVANAQSALRAVPRDLRLYRSLENLAARQVPGGLSFRREIGPSFDIVFKQNGETASGKQDVVVPYFFTKRGFLDFFAPKNDALSVMAIEDAWVTGERDQVRYSPEDLEAFREKIRHRYATAYIDTWSRAFSGLEIVDFRNVDDAMRVLQEINGPANPFGRLLMLVKGQSEIYEARPVATNAEQLLTEVKFDTNREQGLRISRAFSRLSQIVAAKENEKPYFEELMGTINGLETYVRAIKGGQDSSKPIALERAQERARLQGDDPIFIIRRSGANLPDPFNRFLTQIADNSWKVVLLAAKIDLQTVWQDKVYRAFNVGLAARYPFDRTAQDEVSLAEFQQFFGPSGDFESFFKEYLQTFINENTGQPVIIDGQSLAVSAEFVTEINRIRRIRDIFFDAQGAPTLRYTVEPVSLSGRMSRAVLNIEGQLVPYSHGPSRPISILWPNALSSQQNISQLSVFGARGNSGTAALSFQGLWSSYRLFDKATITNARPESLDLTFTVGGGGKVLYRLRMASPENPFQTRPLSRLKLPETL